MPTAGFVAELTMVSKGTTTHVTRPADQDVARVVLGSCHGETDESLDHPVCTGRRGCSLWRRPSRCTIVPSQR